MWQTDRNTSDNSVIDMYSTVKRYFNPSDTTASVTNCDIEHMFPNSWWGAKAGCKEAYCDLHHLVPADYSANRSKSNNGPGVPTDTTFNNGVWVNGKDAARDNIIVFCPPDEYKGDFARALMYTAMTYGDTVTWQTDNATPHMDNDSWQEFKPATSALLLAWHRADPVSDKERERMEAVYRIQHNRNPFIDYPCLAEYIWGDKVGTPVSLALLTSAYDAGFVDEGCTPITTPFITSPYGTVHVGSTKTSVALNYAVKVRGINLTNGDLTLSLSGANAGLFSLSTTSVSKTDAEAGYDVTITYTPTGVGEHTATLTISGCGVTSQTVTITGTCATYYTATWKTGSTIIHATTDAPSGTSPDLPEKPGDCTAPRVFVGWTAQENVSNKPADLFTEQAPALTSNKTFYAVYAGATPGDLDAGSEVYTFTSKSWEAEEGDWTSGKNGYGFSEEQGVQVSGSVSGANATCPNSYNDIRTVVVTYSTNKSSGAGDIVIAIDGTTKTNGVSYSSGGQTLRDSKFDFTAAPKNGAVKITVNQTGGSIYIKSITINHGTPTTYSDYSLSCGGEAVEVTATFKNGTATHATETGLSGTTIDTPADPTPCGDYTFYCWSTQEYETLNAAAPEEDYTGYFALTDKTYHAVYKRTEGSGGGGAAAGTTLWEENFTTFGQDSIPTGPGTAATVYGSATITYTCGNGTNTANTRVLNNGTMYAGGVKPELMVVSKNGSFSVSGIPTGNAKVMTLTFKSNKGTDMLSLTSGTSGITIGDVTVSSNTWTCDISNTTNETFSLTITNTSTGSTGARVDDFEVSVKTPASGSGSTYYTTSPDCGECTYLLTVQSEDEAKGTAAIETLP